MSPSEILDRIRNHPAHKVKVALTDIDGVLRGKVMHRDKFLSAAEKGFGFCDVVFGWDIADSAYDNATYTGWHSGYPDAPVRIDLSTFRQIPWESELPFFLADLSGQDDAIQAVCPRTLLKTVIARAHAMGFSPMMAEEFEWFNFAETPQSLENKGYIRPEPLTPGMFGYSILRASQQSPFFNELFDLLRRFDVPLEGLHTETGPGVYEAAIVVSPALEAADRAVLFKSGVKEIASRHGIMASFMAKWNPALPGCSGHVHQSLWDVEGKTNLFYDAAQPNHMSKVMQHYLAGQLYALPVILPMFAPTINSYKRLVEGAWAPTTPTWGIDNRTVALRALPGSPTATRLETRVCGSDVNPYLALAGCLAAGLYGIANELPLPERSTGNGYADLSRGILPRNLWEASRAMKESELPAQLFGAAFCDHFVRTREWEWREYSKAVTDWETRRYFEIV